MLSDQEAPVHVILGATGGVGSELARRLASNGAHLVLGGRSAEKLGRQEDQLLISVREQLASWYGPKAFDWCHLRTYRLPRALSSQPAPALSIPERPVRMRPGLYVCGDHRDNASINGALVSGKRAARAVLKDFSSPA